ncbi:hypothetical protein RAM19_05615 [Bartonella apihabitans]|nr:hypothetical protein [Bartonella apihabitans]WLT09607.1 hypothetical protein RAM19_05615 [Bartonella apihabitans]
MNDSENKSNIIKGVKYISALPGQCKFPLWENLQDFTLESLVCGEPTGSQNVSYCPAHRMICLKKKDK